MKNVGELNRMLEESGEKSMEVIDQPLYDTVLLDGQDVISFFTDSYSPEKREDKTNMHLPHQLPKPCMFLIEGFALSCPFPTLLIEATFSLHIASKRWFIIAPASLLVRRTVTTIPDSKHNYTPWELDIPIAIMPEQNFGCELYFPHKSPGTMEIRCELIGKYLRSLR